ncbi:MAG: T9SS type A sorting domain-containing protein [Bacteroidetes bacterium]|nr:T9SS type A sorting domain-containing protein [Bacteroidota bacterium]
MKKKISTCIYLMLISSLIYSQQNKRNNVWTVGYQPVVKFNFNGLIQIDTVLNVNMPVAPGCAIKSSSSTIADTNGNLLFFSNGFILYDRDGFGMENGTFINCPYGNVLNNYYGGASLFDQTSIILPKKGNTYYVFSTGMSDSVANNYINHVYTEFDVLNYSVVDMDSNAGMGKVVQKNVVLADKQHYVNCAMQAVKHSNGKDWWLVKADCINNRYQEFLVKEDSILGPYYLDIPINYQGDFCYFLSKIYFNNTGTQMASSICGHILGGPFYYRNGVDIFDFDRCNGELTFKKRYEVPEDTSSYPNYDVQVGLSFSPNDKLLYMSNSYTVYQIDLEDTNTYNALFIHGPDTTIAQFPEYNTIGLAPDGNIYMGYWNGSKSMSYIDSPNVKGLGCNFVSHGVWQPYTYLMSPPNMPNYGLGADTVLCWPLGSSDIRDERLENLEVYPNPGSTIFYIKNLQGKKKELYNTVGTKLFSTFKDEIEINKYAKGIYIIRCEGMSKKVIIE